MQHPRRRSTLVMAVVVVAAVAAIAIWLAAGRSSSRSRSSAAAAVVHRAPPSAALRAPSVVGAAASSSPVPEVVAEPGTAVSDPAARAVAAERLDETARTYRETMTFPLWSRPADDSTASQTRWNEPISVGQEFAVDEAKRELEVSAGIDRVFARAGQAVAVTVTVRYRDDGAPAAADEVDAQVQWRDRDSDTWVTAAAVPLRGAAGVWTGAVVPSTTGGLRETVREARILAFVRRGEYSRELSLDFAYALEPEVVVRGLASDRVVDGNLELGLDVELAAAAPVRLIATLFAADGTTALAVFDDRHFPTRAGRQVLPVRVFGKILRDRGVDGPYRLGAVHGYVFHDGRSPDQVFFEHADRPPLVTAAHRATDFSPAPYHGSDVEHRLAQYQALRDALAQGHEPPPPPPPQP